MGRTGFSRPGTSEPPKIHHMLSSRFQLAGSMIVALSAADACLGQSPAVVPNLKPGNAPEAAGLPAAAAMPTLLVGDAAPALAIEKWVKGAPIAKLEEGTVYLVEFWATWCVPCVRSIPHLNDLEARYSDRGVSVVSVASQEMTPADLDRFVAKQGDKMGYRVGLDRAGETNAAWMTAAGQRGIPTTFLVDRQGRIAWIGHPLDQTNRLEEALARVLDKTLDLSAVRTAWKARIELDAAAAPIIARFYIAAEEGDHAIAVGAADELLALDPKAFGEYAWKKFQIVAIAQKDEKAAYAWAESAAAGAIADNADALAMLASVIVGDSRLQTRDLEMAKRLAFRATALSGEQRDNALAALAEIAARQKDFGGAVEWQTKAVAAAGDPLSRDERSRRLEEYRKQCPGK